MPANSWRDLIRGLKGYTVQTVNILDIQHIHDLLLPAPRSDTNQGRSYFRGNFGLLTAALLHTTIFSMQVGK